MIRSPAHARPLRPSLLAAVVSLAIACGDAVGSDDGSRAVRAIMFVTAPTQVVAVPRSVQLTVSAGNGAVTWSSSRTDLATVSDAGLVTGRSPGTVSITARRGGASSMLVLTVAPGSIEVGPGPLTLAIDESRTLAAITRDANGAVLPNVPVSWSSSDPSVVVVDPGAGIVTARSAGVATISATIGGVSGRVAVTVEIPRSFVDLRFSSIGTVGNYACGIEAETALVHCWGDNHSGALGVGDGAGIPGVANYTPVQVATGTRRFRSVSVGYYSNCALEAETGLAYCWGSNESGQIGDGTADPHSTTLPTLVAGGRVRFSGIAAGGTVSCGVEADTGIGYCWGKGGSIGDGTLAQRSSPTPVGSADGRPRFGSIAVGGTLVCAIEADSGLAYCWGHNTTGTLGDGTTTDRLIPTLVGGGRLRFASISASDGVTCGLERDSGVAYCWGPNDYGQVGDGTTARRLEPTRVAGGLRFSSIDAGDGMVCAVEAASGAGYCWGRNLDGSLGDGTTASRSTPTLVGGGRLRFLQISAGGAGGGYEACGIAAPTGRAFCWGHGALVPTPIWQAAPAAVAAASARLVVHR